jgi:hypothetical protein
MIEPSFSTAAGMLPTPRRILNLVGVMARIRGDVALAEQRRVTITAVAATLAASGREATVQSREPGGVAWSVSVGAVTGRSDL